MINRPGSEVLAVITHKSKNNCFAQMPAKMGAYAITGS
jgi:hypothetical protein